MTRRIEIAEEDLLALVRALPSCRCGAIATHVHDYVFPPSRAPGGRLRYYNAAFYCRTHLALVAGPPHRRFDDGQRCSRVRPLGVERALKRLGYL